MMDDNGDVKPLTMLQRIDRAVGFILPSGLGGLLCVLAERHCRVKLYPTMEEFQAMTEAEYRADMAVRMAAEDGMPWFWRQVYRTGRNLLSIEINLDELRRLEYWKKIYLPCPGFLFETVLETVCRALFGNIRGPARKEQVMRWLRRAWNAAP
jgi:hypothetical protein